MPLFRLSAIYKKHANCHSMKLLLKLYYTNEYQNLLNSDRMTAMLEVIAL